MARKVKQKKQPKKVYEPGVFTNDDLDPSIRLMFEGVSTCRMPGPKKRDEQQPTAPQHTA